MAGKRGGRSAWQRRLVRGWMEQGVVWAESAAYFGRGLATLLLTEAIKARPPATPGCLPYLVRGRG